MPKTIEVDEATYLQQKGVIDVLSRVAQNPKAKLLVQQAHKLVDPNAATPDLDRENSENERVSALQKQIDDFKAAQEKEKREAAEQRRLEDLQLRIDSGLSKLRTEHRLTDEGVKKIRDIMESEGIVNPDTAFAVFEKRHPPPLPENPRGNGAWNFMTFDETDQGAEYAKKLLESKASNDLVLDREVHAALNDVRGASR